MVKSTVCIPGHSELSATKKETTNTFAGLADLMLSFTDRQLGYAAAVPRHRSNRLTKYRSAASAWL